MFNQSLEKAVKTFVSELKSAAIEYGFKADAWIIKMATAIDKSAIKKKFYPTLCLEVQPEASSEMLAMVVQRIAIPSGHEAIVDKASIGQYLIAYHPERRY